MLRARGGDVELALEALFEMNSPDAVTSSASCGRRGDGGGFLKDGGGAQEEEEQQRNGLLQHSGWRENGDATQAWASLQDPTMDAATAELLLCGGEGRGSGGGSGDAASLLQQQVQQSLIWAEAKRQQQETEAEVARLVAAGQWDDGPAGGGEWSPGMEDGESEGRGSASGGSSCSSRGKVEELRIFFSETTYSDDIVSVGGTL